MSTAIKKSSKAIIIAKMVRQVNGVYENKLMKQLKEICNAKLFIFKVICSVVIIGQSYFVQGDAAELLINGSDSVQTYYFGMPKAIQYANLISNNDELEFYGDSLLVKRYGGKYYLLSYNLISANQQVYVRSTKLGKTIDSFSVKCNGNTRGIIYLFT